MRNALVSRHWHIACVACFISWLKKKKTYITCMVRLFHVMALIKTCGALFFRIMALKTTYITTQCSALVPPYGFKNDVYYMRSTLVSPHSLKNDVYYMCSALFSPHGFKNYVYYMCSPLVSPYGLKIFISPSRADFRWFRSTLAKTNCLHRIRSSLFANIRA